MLQHRTRRSACAALACIAAGAADAQSIGDTPGALVESREIPVTLDNFVRAATDIELAKYVALAGGINRFHHFREPTPVDNQPTVRMNRDTLYSTAVVDISEGATLTLPVHLTFLPCYFCQGGPSHGETIYADIFYKETAV